ncbi:hypothetical protein SAMN02800694_3315 [Luteibacter sp. UNCMF331Sha3.1]|nr:hypothetical protein SAMN02800694_3315 [Luteibacter sp. UNCMF331Sha3.1]
MRIRPPTLFPAAQVVARLAVPEANLHGVSDANGRAPHLIGVAFDAMGSRVSGAVIQYHVESDGGTGSGFYVEGVDHLLMDSVAVTQDDGTAIPMDRWVTGPNPGTAAIRATPVDGTPDASVLYTRTVSDRVPATLRILSGGEVIRNRPGEIATRVATVELRDEQGDPVTWGRVAAELVDDDKTRSGLATAIRDMDANGRATLEISVACWFWRGGPTKHFHIEIYRPGYRETTTQSIPCELILAGAP